MNPPAGDFTAPTNLKVTIVNGNVFTGTWDPVVGAARYEWQVVRNDGIKTSGTATQATAAGQLAYGAANTVTFQVRAVAADGRTSSWTSLQAYPAK